VVVAVEVEPAVGREDGHLVPDRAAPAGLPRGGVEADDDVAEVGDRREAEVVGFGQG
jgi:hypothetical protein